MLGAVPERNDARQWTDGSTARLRTTPARDERAWREARRTGATLAQAPSPTGTHVGRGVDNQLLQILIYLTADQVSNHHAC
jgi:hypothetical protein